MTHCQQVSRALHNLQNCLVVHANLTVSSQTSGAVSHTQINTVSTPSSLKQFFYADSLFIQTQSS